MIIIKKEPKVKQNKVVCINMNIALHEEMTEIAKANKISFSALLTALCINLIEENEEVN